MDVARPMSSGTGRWNRIENHKKKKRKKIRAGISQQSGMASVCDGHHKIIRMTIWGRHRTRMSSRAIFTQPARRRKRTKIPSECCRLPSRLDYLYESARHKRRPSNTNESFHTHFFSFYRLGRLGILDWMTVSAAL